MIGLVSILSLGFFLGMRHALDADHVIAVSTIVSRQRSIVNAARIGAIWGIGHTLTLIVVGGTIFLLGLTVPAKLGLSMELSVGVMLIVLGIFNLQSFSQSICETCSHGMASAGSVQIHAHSHEAGEPAITHTHSEDKTPTARLDRWFGSLRLYQILRPLLVGVVHGLAGSAAVALLVLPLIHKPLWALLYLLIFGIGTIAGMMLVTAVVAVPFSFSSGRAPSFHRRLALISGWLSVGFGLFLVYQIGFVERLFIE